MEKTKRIALKNKGKNYKIWLLLSIVALYPLYYYFTNLPDTYSFESLFLDDFGNSGLLLLIFLFPLSMLIIRFSQKNKSSYRDFIYHLSIEDNVLYQHTERKTYLIKPKSNKEMLSSQDSRKTPLTLKVDQILHIKERRRSGTHSSERISTTISGSNTIGDRLGQPLELTKITSNYDYMESYFVYKDGSRQAFHASYSIDELKEFLKI